jgi:hypothetical protein
MKLSSSAKTALETVREKHLAYMIAKANIEAELKRELGIRLETIRNERDSALRYAVQVGVPKTQLGKAIGTSNYKTVQEILGSMPQALVSPVSEKIKIDVMSENSCQVYLTDIGDTGFTGSAFMSVSPDGELEFIDGDLAVITQIYRNNFLNNILDALGR